MIPPGLLPEGLRDRLPPQAEATAALVHGLTATFASHGYERVQPPLVEYEESLGSRLGGAARRELLRFTDPISQHTLALRSDITGQVGRIAVTRLAATARPLRLSYAGPVLRVRGTQLSPERESVQVGVELIGSDSPAAAGEVVSLAVTALAGTGLAGLSLDLTMPTLVADLVAAGWPLGRASLADVQALLDGKDVGGLHALGAGAFEPLIAAAGPADAALARLAALPLPDAVRARLDAVAALVAALPDIAVTLDPTERHGFEYQTWIGFSLFGAGVPGEIGRGGAYAIVTPEGATEAAIGFSLYVDGLVDAGLGVVDARRVLLPLGTDAAVAARLRADGWATVAALSADARPADFRCTHILDGVEPRAI
ncbi:ATP phosphoribosyltransferase regulatory subunit [Polymorphobacter fuscus]|uniref:ATP phosphoribosyltransferase regulatory subunit n=1 Tax=Sandarakinorhabdus fusca TaxID=1439888 RepID=A0A7C9KVL8_9SPHN|nr:ATP phosphoribosyltransferase regulatory subunit [Polymorphobacter fuscus]KAB7648494.1 ATP phosphoribosyltransferase regulatory subunit [Polymorphobacter fuscus]MQT16022.1 ATP phosphoribosyltransferase regulatory subunit [Polymorphobacter fuscus]NJC07701.1 ATP phosphoribosyltransferase regulatory subunit [Polymorphobacter fuscus]